MEQNKIRKKLQTLYWLLNSTILVVIILLEIFQEKLGYPWPVQHKIWQVLLATLSVLFGLIFPMWLRIWAYKQNFENNSGSSEQLLKFEKTLIILSAGAFALAPIAYILQLNLWVRYLVTFIALYALYYSFPSQKKLNLDKKLFGIR